METSKIEEKEFALKKEEEIQISINTAFISDLLDGGGVGVSIEEEEMLLAVSPGPFISGESQNEEVVKEEKSLSSSPCISMSISAHIYDDIFQLEDIVEGRCISRVGSQEDDIYDDVIMGNNGFNSEQRNSSQGSEESNQRNNNETNTSSEFDLSRISMSISSNNVVIQTSNNEEEDYNNNKQEGNENGYDERSMVLYTNGGGSNHNSSESFKESRGLFRRHAVFLGNLTWWTTDDHISSAMKSIGIEDVLDVKIYDSRLNGQSKGFCLVTFASETSVAQAFEKAGGIKILERIPIIKPDTKQSITFFESHSKTRTNNNNPGGVGINGMSVTYPQSLGIPGRNSFNPSLSMSVRPPMWSNGAGGGRGTIRPSFHNRSYNGGVRNLSPAGLRNGGYHNNNNINNGYYVGPSGLGGYNRMIPRNPYPSHMYENSIQRYHDEWTPSRSSYSVPSVRHSYPPALSPISHPHINPAFLSTGRFPLSLPPPNLSHPDSSLTLGEDIYGTGVEISSPTYSSYYDAQSSASLSKGDSLDEPMMDESEFDELLSRNNSVSTAAIKRAVNDAGKGEFASSIETLVTAISLLRNSKIAGDKRCLVLINSLQDTLEGIEHRSYGGTSHSCSILRKDKDHCTRSHDRSRDCTVSRSPIRRRSNREYGQTSSVSRDYHRSSSSYHQNLYSQSNNQSYRSSNGEDKERRSKIRSWEERDDNDRTNERASKISRVEIDRIKPRI